MADLTAKKTIARCLIRQLEFVDDAQSEWSNRLNKFSHIFNKVKTTHSLLDQIKTLEVSPNTFLETTLKQTCHGLNLPFNVLRSSTLNILNEHRGQDRILAIAKQLGATEYINLSGGRALYDAATFKHHGISLKFLEDYQGCYSSILYRILTEDSHALARDIVKQSTAGSL